MKQISISIAAIGFFALSIVGWFSGVGELLCGLRALAGAVAIYVMCVFVGGTVIQFLTESSAKTEKNEINDGKAQQRP